MRKQQREWWGRLAFATTCSLVFNGLILYLLAFRTVLSPPPTELVVQVSLLDARAPPSVAEPDLLSPVNTARPDQTARVSEDIALPAAISPIAPSPLVRPRTAAPPPPPSSGAANWWPFLAAGCPNQDLARLNPVDRRECEQQRLALGRRRALPVVIPPTPEQQRFADDIAAREASRAPIRPLEARAFGCPEAQLGVGCTDDIMVDPRNTPLGRTVIDAISGE